MRIRKGDTVHVLSGEYGGRQGRVLRVYRSADRVLVQGINMVKKHMRRSQDHPHGARIEKEAPLPASRVMLVCSACGKPTRPRTVQKKGKRVLMCRKCGKAVRAEE